MNAAGEKLAVLVLFDGSDLDSISFDFAAYTAADSMNLEIFEVDDTHDDIDRTGFPSSTAVANSSVDVSDVGGTREWVDFTFGATKPNPEGYYWVVLTPTSAGAFDVRPYMSGEWYHGGLRGINSSLGQQQLFDGTDWRNNVTQGALFLRVKKADGTYLESAITAHPPVSGTDQTMSYREAKNDDAVGLKFVAPFDMEVHGFMVGMTYVDAYIETKVKLIDSSDSILADCSGFYWWASNVNAAFWFANPVTLTEGETYRAYLVNPAKDAQRVRVMTCAGTGIHDYFNMTASDFQSTYADDPVSEGGGGTWTDVATEFPFMAPLGRQDLSNLSGGGGGTSAPAIYSI